jgi:hypothetical protein
VTNLISLLLQFRQTKVPIVADVEKIFHQVRVRSSDGPAFRFIWHDLGDTKHPDIYQMDGHLFDSVFHHQPCVPTRYNMPLKTAKNQKCCYPKSLDTSTWIIGLHLSLQLSKLFRLHIN